ncbi:protein anon-37Cs, putative [Pediculus humanus corporis]|uniref:Protein anon-37Cs, putative n=1 Tax=Pediculus humanus subsp. corporis TaxID=121224 RepID=E0VJP6_PEDHC|nr:protein anon-37Cs, putative [Pediculus humanus corporis]EEB13602.1 protein anon-37Cs, putative [Pediculus humanus corporis]
MLVRHVCSSCCFSAKECPKCPATNAKFVDVCKLDKCMVNPCKPEPTVVIVGGGIAGLSAAQRLVHCGIRNFTVLEATDRPGGRIHSCWMGDVVAEMGAQYINGGCIANPIFTLAAQEGLLSNPLPRPDERGLFCTSDGRAIDFPVSVTALHTFKKIEQQAAALFSMGCGRSHGNLLNFLGIRIQQELHNFPEEQRYDAARVMYGLTNILRTKCGDDLSLISADQFGSYIEIPGGDVRVPLGYVGVLAPLLRDLPECSVRYCKPVQSILWGTIGSSCGPRAVVKCCDGEEFQADYVIVTVSLGVLKAKHDKLFCPALPCEKVEAIRKLGFGVVNKIFLEYTRPFWVWREGGIKLAWSADELASRDDWVKGLCYVEELAGSQHVLCAWVAGREASTMELCSEEEVAEAITRVLRQFTGDPCLPYPANVLRSKWTADCNFCGSYSYMGLESNVGQQCDLGSPVPGSCEPIAPILLFAGEATVPGHYSTVHGARLSGIREAERIIQLTKRFGGPPLPPESMS